MGISRRRLLQAGLLAGASTAFGACSNSSSTTTATGPGLLPPQPGSPAARPNFLIILTDQTREPQHWPAGWVEQNLPSWGRLKRHGLTFRRAYCAASQCSPSRAVLLTGAFANVNGCQLVGGRLNTPAEGTPNLATMLRAAGYDVVWKGKWHLSAPLNGEYWTEEDIEHLERSYGMKGWNPPDAGNLAGATSATDYVSLATLGGGHPNNDGRYVSGVCDGCECGPPTGVPSPLPSPQNCQWFPRVPTQASPPPGGCQTRGFGTSVLDYLDQVGRTPPEQRRPFCLIVSLANPHDISYFPSGFSNPAAGYPAPVPDQGIQLPPNLNDSLVDKPTVQSTYRQALGTEGWSAAEKQGFVNFYAYLHKVVDQHISTVLDALDRHRLTEDTVIFRTADHGELGLSHGLIEKAYCAYEEGLNLPLIVSNPRLFPEPRETRALWSHVDLTATLADLAGASPIGVGVSQAPVLRGQEISVRDAVLFSFDDIFEASIPLTSPASHIRALRTERHTYAVYFTASYASTPGCSEILSAGPPFQYELYDNHQDPLQLDNLADKDPELRKRLHDRLSAEMTAVGVLLPGWPPA